MYRSLTRLGATTTACTSAGISTPSCTVRSTRTTAPCGSTRSIRPTPTPSTLISEPGYTPTALAKYAVILVPDAGVVAHHSAPTISNTSTQPAATIVAARTLARVVVIAHPLAASAVSRSPAG